MEASTLMTSKWYEDDVVYGIMLLLLMMMSLVVTLTGRYDLLAKNKIYLFSFGH